MFGFFKIFDALITDLDGHKLHDNSVPNEKIIDIDGSKIRDNTISDTKIISVNGSKIVDNTITDSKIVSLNGSKIQDGTVDISKLKSLADIFIKGLQVGGNSTDFTVDVPNGIRLRYKYFYAVNTDSDGRVLMFNQNDFDNYRVVCFINIQEANVNYYWNVYRDDYNNGNIYAQFFYSDGSFYANRGITFNVIGIGFLNSFVSTYLS